MVVEEEYKKSKIISDSSDKRIKEIYQGTKFEKGIRNFLLIAGIFSMGLLYSKGGGDYFSNLFKCSELNKDIKSLSMLEKDLQKQGERFASKTYFYEEYVATNQGLLETNSFYEEESCEDGAKIKKIAGAKIETERKKEELIGQRKEFRKEKSEGWNNFYLGIASLFPYLISGPIIRGRKKRKAKKLIKTL